MARRKCVVCGSRQWRKEPTSGLVTCSEGHVLQDYRNEVRDIEELGPHTLKKRAMKSGRKKKERMSRADPKLYHGDRARFHYFQCLQLILRMQVQNLIKLWYLPSEFEIVCRDIWALHLSLIPKPPQPEPYFFRQDIAGGAPLFSSNNAKAAETPTSSTGDNNADTEEDHKSDDESSESGSSSSDESSSSEESSDTEEDENMRDLMREAEEEESSSSEDENKPAEPKDLDSKPQPSRRAKKTRSSYSVYDSPVNTVAVLMLGCWTLRIPVTYMDFKRVIESYDLVYLDPVRLLPATLVRHLTKHTIQALSPHYAPQPLHVHSMVSRLAKLVHKEYGIFTPECNIAPLLWRAVRAFEGTPTLYTLTKRVADVLSLPLTLHYSLAPALERVKKRDPSWHRFDNTPVEVSLVCTIIIVLKLVYGLDGTPRVPNARSDPAYALPELNALLEAIHKTEQDEQKSMENVLSLDPDITALDLTDDQLDKYLAFCEKALLPREDRMADHPTVKEYFPLHQSTTAPTHRDALPASSAAQANPAATAALPGISLPSSTQPTNTKSSTLHTGQSYAVYSSSDILGTVPEDFEVIVRRAACWTGVDEEFIFSVVENLERRFVRWWNSVEQERSVAKNSEDTAQ